MSLQVAELCSDYSLPISHIEVLDSFRVPRWRFDEAEHLRFQAEDNPLSKLRHRDKLVQRLANFLHQWNLIDGESQAARTRARRRKLARKYADFLWAYPVFEKESYDLVRLEMEARILAGQSDDEIARCLQVPARMVALYHYSFFEVRHRLDNKAYVLSNCMNSATVDLENRSKEFMVRFFGYFGGPHMLEPFLYEYPTHLSVPSDPSQLSEYFKDVFRQTLARRGVQLASFFNLSRFNASEVLATVRSMHDADDLGQAGSVAGIASTAGTATMVNCLVEAVKWHSGDDGADYNKKVMGDLHGAARRLSARDHAKVLAGETVKGLSEVVSYEFPQGRAAEKDKKHEDN